MIPETDSLNRALSLEELTQVLIYKIDKIKNNKNRLKALKYHIYSLCLIYLYIKDNFYYSPYFKLESSVKPNKIIKMLFANSNHFYLLYKKNHIFKFNNTIQSEVHNTNLFENKETKEKKFLKIRSNLKYNNKILYLINSQILKIMINKKKEIELLISNKNVLILGKIIYHKRITN